MLGQLEAPLFRDLVLPTLDFLIEEFFDTTAIKAYQVIVMRALIKLEHGFAGFEVIPAQNARLLELRQYPIDRCQSNI